MKTVAIIQARMGSSRLPGKVLLPLAGKPVLRQVYERTCCVHGVDEVLVATTTARADDVLAEFCTKATIPFFRGSEEDVLDRYVQAARTVSAEAVMRITADCPFLDPQVSASVLERFLEIPDCDYATNTTPPTFPDGLDTSVTRFSTLEQTWREVLDAPYREHVTLFIASHPERFRIAQVLHPIDLSGHRWTLDEPEDFQMLSRVADELQVRKQFGYMDEILAILRDHPEWVGINARIGRNEGLKLSWEKWEASRSKKGSNL